MKSKSICRPEGNPSDGVGAPNTMISTVRRRGLSLVVAACLALGMGLDLPGPVGAVAAGIGLGAPELVQGDVIGFAGHEWVVLEASGGSATLLLKDGDAGGGFGSSVVRPKADTPLGTNWRPHGLAPHYYPDFVMLPNEYADSYLQKRIEQIWRGFPEGEQALIIPRDLDEISGPDVPGQLLWPLSTFECTTNFAGNPGLDYSARYWLRSETVMDTTMVAAYEPAAGGSPSQNFVEETILVRPAFYLDASGAFFTSSVSGGKSGGIGSLTAATSPTGAVKLTVIDPEQTTEITATAQQAAQKGGVLFFGYRDAETGLGRYISCFLESRGGGGDYYGRLTDLGGGGTSGVVRVPLSGVADGVYTLYIFGEQANGGNRTDFAGRPATMTLAVSGGQGTVSDFVGAGADATYSAVEIYNPRSGSGSSSGDGQGSGGGQPAPEKAEIPASAFSWNGGRTLTIDHERITPLGISRVTWDGVETTAYKAYKGSVIIRFDADFMAGQAPGEHTVGVEFMNHVAEMTVTVGETPAVAEAETRPAAGEAADETGEAGEQWDNISHNPNTGR